MNSTHHIESVISAVLDMFEVQARGRQNDREMWFLVRDHAKVAEGELERLREENGRQREAVEQALICLQTLALVDRLDTTDVAGVAKVLTEALARPTDPGGASEAREEKA